MLTAEQVIPFLSSDDPILRDQACSYFQFANDVGPLTALTCWEAINHLGLTGGASRVIRLLSTVPQNDESTLQLLAALDSPVTGRVRSELRKLPENIDFEQLRRHHGSILARTDLSEHARAHLRERLDLAEVPSDALWEELQKLVNGSSQELWDAMDRGRDSRLLEALARFGEPVAMRAMEILKDSTPGSNVMESYTVDLLGRLRYRPALDLMIERLLARDDDDDALWEDLEESIPRAGGVDAIAPLEERFLKGSWWQRLTFVEIISRVSHPASEAALLRLIESPDIDADSRDRIAAALGTLCTTDGLPRLREIAISGNYDPRSVDVKLELVACALMAGFDFPELPAMREEVVARDIQTRCRIEEFDDDLAEEDTDDEFDDDDWDEKEYEEEEEEDEDDADFHDFPPLPSALEDRQPPVTRTIVNEQPKVGRNDPCPCGSGKKYKKCCLN